MTVTDRQLPGRVALVVGASSGMGLGVTVALAAGGARVHAAARRSDQIAVDGVVTHRLDITDAAAVRALAAALAESEPIDLLVLTVGENIPERAMDQLTDDSWSMMIDVNLNGAFRVMSAFLPQLIETRGDAVLVSSVSGLWPDESGPAYQVAKAGVIALGRAANHAVHGKGVRVTNILPGITDTPLMDKRPVPPSAEVRAASLRPEDVAAAVIAAVTLPGRAHMAEITIIPTQLQSVGFTNVANPVLGQ